MSDVSGDITLTSRYTPWGGTLDTYGTGNFTFGYLGGILDATTNLIYVGNGQYYDPATGRFLSRGVNPDSTNPYTPWNPIGAIVGPLGLITFFSGRKKKGSKAGTFLVLLLVMMTIGMTLSACGPAPTPAPGSPITPTPTQTPIPTEPLTIPTNTLSTTPSPTNSPTATPCTPTALPSPTLLPPPASSNEEQKIEYLESLGVILIGNWTGTFLNTLWDALINHIGYIDLVRWLNGSKVTMQQGSIDKCPMMIDPTDPDRKKLIERPACYGGLAEYTTITFSTKNMVNPVMNMLHEMGHAVDNIWHDYFTQKLRKVEFTLNGQHLSGWNGTEYTSLPRETVKSQALISTTVGGGVAWQQLAPNEGKDPYNYTCTNETGTNYKCWPESEDWADIFANAMVNDGNINQYSKLGGQMYNFYKDMEDHVMGVAP